jgi:hypothetical protein
MAIPSDTCALCCTCPTATVEWDTFSLYVFKQGFLEFSGYVSSPRKYYTTLTASGIPYSILGYRPDFCDTDGSSESFTGLTTGVLTISGLSNIAPCDSTIPTTVTYTPFLLPPINHIVNRQFYDLIDGDSKLLMLSFPCWGNDPSNACGSGHYLEGPPSGTTSLLSPSASSSTSATYTDGVTTGTAVLSVELTTAVFKAAALAVSPTYSETWAGTAGSFFNLTPSEDEIYLRASRYRLRFKIPKVNTGKNLRASWVERFIAEAGVTVSSVEVYKRGVYRPTVTIGAPPSGGVQARAVAVMSSTGTVASISILNPGSGYVSAPTVTIQSATGGGTTSTGWTATLTAGSVTAIAGGTAGDYRPTLAFSGGGGSSATATCTVNAQGGIDVVTVTASGTAYTSEPTLTITPKVSGSTAADLLIHLGTETSKCTVWDGATPGGYDSATSSTWPILPSAAPNYYSLAVPSTDGTTLVANVRTYCDGSTC